ncbi:MAG: hypothetical protein COZ16_10250 [Flavobacteriaceae bacterium CG_4_10_14_3_um_filter_31_253]|nr:MAG: hypothetical protein AUK46_00265 [Flavobacteriaceae bacterium CG2_30_31_66]PIV95463.1 MAG: hypothetical protein COW43_13090 [Flavobacteriaceae bacterium CG17_big_fil_post_rev_8_21_14_2_50_31_13]PIX12526.1 MAG: hypothetical protein COZ74_11020 [Flavobacteriaceae bacterium CG_4_8_14_3_um_filter_31_8]PIY14172.1 MAG: hypothetical protein COZ16_10250 [Flavobacteriaceae bacterium CG_4_10_14_3_um_filter_31_253]PIZ10281.1 MAG: hypothetical protein COY55_08990 [Flavobacteriaceae bacterium CG_4_1
MKKTINTRKMKSKVFLIGLIFTTILSCNKELNSDNQNQINGLWLVKSFKVNNMEIPSSENWIRFNADSSLSSGNDWLQHSVGYWRYQQNTKLLTINTEIGFTYYKSPFSVEIHKTTMIWKGTKEGMEVIIILEKAEKLPTSEANKLFGLWKFDSVFIGDNDVLDSLNPNKKAMLFFRWDNQFEFHNYPEGEKYGIFKIQPYRNQLEMINYSSSPKFQFYDFKIEGENLELKSKDEKTVLKFSRIHQFLE